MSTRPTKKWSPRCRGASVRPSARSVILRRMRLPLLFASLAIFASCKSLEEPPPPPFRVAIVVQSDKDVPLPGVLIRRGDKELGKSEPNGKAILTFRGEEGDQIDVWVKCPEGFDSPVKPTTVALRRLTDPNKLAEYPVMC